MDTINHPTVQDSVHGLSLLTAALFIVGETAGTGVLALPQAVAGCGWIGILIIILACFAAGFTGIFLGKSWLLLEQLHPEYSGFKVSLIYWPPQNIVDCIKCINRFEIRTH